MAGERKQQRKRSNTEGRTGSLLCNSDDCVVKFYAQKIYFVTFCYHFLISKSFSRHENKKKQWMKEVDGENLLFKFNWMPLEVMRVVYRFKSWK